MLKAVNIPHTTEQTPCMLKFKNHFDLLVDKKKPHQKASDIVCMRKMFLMEYLLQVYIHTCAVDEMAVF